MIDVVITDIPVVLVAYVGAVVDVVLVLLVALFVVAVSDVVFM